MLRSAIMMAAILGLADCAGDETVTGYGAADITWTLREIDGRPFAARATLTFPEKGKLDGQAPCNRYFGAQTAPYPWFAAENVAATRRACAELDAETAYLAALSQMTLAEVAGDTLILSNDAGRQLVFDAAR